MLIMVVEPPSLSARKQQWGHVQILATLCVGIVSHDFFI